MVNPKQTAKKGGVDKRKGGKRADLSHAGVRRLLILSSSERIPNVRVSSEAVDAVQDLVQDFLKKLAEQLNALVAHAQRKTVNRNDVKYVCELLCPECVYALNTVQPSTKKNRSDISIEGILRQLKLYGMSLRVTEHGKNAIRGVVEGYIMHIGKRASCIVKGANRNTIKQRDISLSLC